MTRARAAAFVATVLLVPWLTACTTGYPSCTGIDAATSPSPAVAGHEVSVHVTGALYGCSDTGGRPNVALESVNVRLIEPLDDELVAEITVPIADDFEGKATLSLAGVEPGLYELWVDDHEVNELEIIAP